MTSFVMISSRRRTRLGALPVCFVRRLPPLAAAVFLCSAALYGQSVREQIRAQHDPARRSEVALNLADTAFDSAKGFYSQGEVHKGDAQLEDMTNALNECVQSLDEARKAKFYKKAELHVAFLQRRMKCLLDDIEMQQRGWAEYTERKLDEIHDKLLDGVMRK